MEKLQSSFIDDGNVKWNIMAFPQKLEYGVTICPRNFTTRHMHKKTENMSTTNLFTNVYINIIHNS